MVFNITVNNISVTSWWSVLLVEKTRVPRENHRPEKTTDLSEVTDKPLSHNGLFKRENHRPEKTTDLSEVTDKPLSHNGLFKRENH